MYRGIAHKGEGVARALGFPTINIPCDDASLSGSYVGKVTVKGKTYSAAVYANRARKILEAHLLDFRDEVYGEEVTIELGEHLRESQKFDNEADLKAAIARDVEEVRRRCA